MSDPIVIVGAGQAAGQAIVSLRQEGFDGPITLVGDEAYIPYQRPPLSKKFLSGEMGLERVYLKPEAFFADQGVELCLGRRAVTLNRTGRSIALDDGSALTYSKLLLTTGSRVRRLPVPGEGLEGVHYLRTVADVLAIRGALTPGCRLVIVGAGYIGLEVTAVAARMGAQVTVLEMETRVLARVTAPAMSTFFEREHRAQGVDIRLQTRVQGFTDDGTGKLAGIECADGSRIEADLAIVGIGILPNVELAEAAGLPCDNGIVVDEHAQTADPDIFAAGDCANHPNDLVGKRIRLESVQNAIDQAKAAAAAMCGNPRPYTEVPWFWSDQYDLKLQIAGLAEGYDDTVVRGNPEDRAFAMFYLKDGVLIAVDAVNAVPEFMIGRKMIGARARVLPERLADLSLSMKDLGKEVVG